MIAALAFGVVACGGNAPAVVAPQPPPAAPVVAPPPWPVPLRVLRWGPRGLDEVGRLPGLATLPTEPWLVEPIDRPRDAATWAALIGELARHDVPEIGRAHV